MQSIFGHILFGYTDRRGGGDDRLIRRQKRNIYVDKLFSVIRPHAVDAIASVYSYKIDRVIQIK